MPVSPSGPARRTVVHGLLAAAGLTALGACGRRAPAASPTDQSPAAEPAPSTAATTPEASQAQEAPDAAASPSPVPETPSREEIVAEFAGREPTWFDLVGLPKIGRASCRERV